MQIRFGIKSKIISKKIVLPFLNLTNPFNQVYLINQKTNLNFLLGLKMDLKQLINVVVYLGKVGTLIIITKTIRDNKEIQFKTKSRIITINISKILDIINKSKRKRFKHLVNGK